MAARSPERCGGRPAVHWRAGDRATGRRDTEQRGGVMDEQPAVGAARDLGWLLDDLADRVDYFRRAVILSRDGLVVAASAGLNREDAEHLSALAAGCFRRPEPRGRGASVRTGGRRAEPGQGCRAA